MKTKDEVFKHFQEFKALVENVIGRKIQTLWSDNKRELVGIRREWTVPYNLWLNGVTKRKNWSISKEVKAMFYD